MGNNVLRFLFRKIRDLFQCSYVSEFQTCRFTGIRFNDNINKIIRLFFEFVVDLAINFLVFLN